MRPNKINKNTIDKARILKDCFCVLYFIPIIHISGKDKEMKTIILILQASNTESNTNLSVNKYVDNKHIISATIE